METTSFMDLVEQWVATADSFLWGPPLLVLLLGTHLYYTIRLRFVQRNLGKAFKLVIKKDGAVDGNVSPMGALAVAMASTIGTGNVVGVATAISLGGPGAVFWCMVTGIFGMATKYAESMLAVKYRTVRPDGEVNGGPMHTIQNGLKCHWLAMAFAIAGAIAVIGTGDLVQSNAIASVVHKTFGAPTWAVGLGITILATCVLVGGLKWIANVCTAFVPFMSSVYIIGCFILLYFNRAVLGDTVVLIVKSAFTAKAAAGGVAGYGLMLAARYGIARGLFSNEAGMGSEPIVAATAQTRNAVRQGLVSYTGTFFTIIICAITGLVVVSSAIANPMISLSDKDLLTQSAFEQIPYFGKYLLSFAIFSFATTTILGWFYYGEQCVKFISRNPIFVNAYKVLFIVCIYLGSIGTLSLVWNVADFANGFMVIPNIISLLWLSNVVVRETKEYLWSNQLDKVSPECANNK